MEDYKAKGGDVSHVASVASFFVSRIDAVIDKQIDTKVRGGRPDAAHDLKRIRGKVAIANAKLAYQHYLSLIGSDRWKTLAAPARCRSGCCGPAPGRRTRPIATCCMSRG